MKLDVQSVDAKDKASKLSRSEKAAIVLHTLGPEYSKPIVEKFSQTQLQNFAKALNNIDIIEKPVIELVFEEFYSLIANSSVQGGKQALKSFLSESMNGALADQVLENLDDEAGMQVWSRISSLNTRLLVDYLHKETAQTAAIILTKINQDKMRKVMNKLDDAFAKEVLLAIANLVFIDPDVVKDIEQVLYHELIKKIEQTNQTLKPKNIILGLISKMSDEKSADYLSFIESHNPELSDQLKRSIFKFEDLEHRVDAKYLSFIVKEADINKLILALRHIKDKNSSLYEKLIKSMSKRFADQIIEEVANLQTYDVVLAEEAKKEIAELTLSLASRGDIQIQGQDEDED